VTTPSEDEGSGGFGRTARRSAAAVLGLLILVLVFQNTDVVAVRLLFWRVEMSLALLVILVAGISAVAAVLATMWSAAKRRRQSRAP